MRSSRGSSAVWEKRLNINTSAGGFERDDANHSRYEPTDYTVLERLAQSGYICRDDVLVDYGCGKGRVGFFLNHTVGCRTIGVEYNEEIYSRALENLSSYTGRKGADNPVSFVCMPAESYDASGANCFYFFNPFSEVILRTVLRRILESYYENPRKISLFFYYALDSYLSCLMTSDEFRLIGEISCRDLFHNDDPRERILVFQIGE